MCKLETDFIEGMSLRKIADKHGMTYSSVRWALHNVRNITMRKHGSSRLDLPIDQIRKEYLQGSSIYSLARDHGVSRATITKRLKEQGVQPRKENRVGRYKLDLPDAQIKADYKSGMTLKDLAEKYKVSTFTIKNRIS